jgi:hypothetical protein
VDELEEELRHNEEEYFSERLERLKEIESWFQVPEGGLSFGPDWESSQALQEARFAYVYGFWMSAILMSLTAIERHLAWRLSTIGIKNTEHLPAQAIIERATSFGFVTETQAAEINRVRKDRNDFAHFRLKSRYWTTLSALVDGAPEDEMAGGVNVNLVLQADAAAAVKLASAYFLISGRDSFSDPR